jgi:hypothetical protein
MFGPQPLASGMRQHSAAPNLLEGLRYVWGDSKLLAPMSLQAIPAFQAFDLDDHHNRLWWELVPPILERADRCQFHIEGEQVQSDRAVG